MSEIPGLSPDSVSQVGPDAWLAAIVESSDDAIVGKTLDSVIRSWNSGARRIFGYEADEIIGQTIYTLIPPELQHEEPEIIARLVRGERVDHYETIRVAKDGTRIEVSLSVSPIRNAAGEVIGAAKVARDVTEAKRLQRAERELLHQLQELTAELEQQVEEAQSLQEEVEQSNNELLITLADVDAARAQAEVARRMADDANAAKSQFLATMSHELRTPLNAILGYVDLLDADVHGPLTDGQRHALGRVRRSQQLLHRLVEHVLGFAKLESGKVEYRYEDVALNSFLATLEGFIAPSLVRKNLEYRFQPAGGDAIVSIDREKLEQILLNLLSNAVKFTARGRIDVRSAVDDDVLRVEVQDTGRGIPNHLLNAIFEPFVQGDQTLTRPAEGTGLGLAICRQLARGMGGDVTVESVEGEGATFVVVLPRRHNSVRPAAE